MIALINYSMGNISSVANGFKLLYPGEKILITRDHKVIQEASYVVFPGVGAMRDCMKELSATGLDNTIKDVIQKGTPFLGICLGFQALFEESSEFGTYKGLGVLKGSVIPFAKRAEFLKQDITLKVPQIGWNSVKQAKETTLFQGIPDESYFYFVHSYYVAPKVEENTLATTSYGIDYCSGVETENVVGVQFHPEKSQHAGLRFLQNFLNKG